MWKSILCDYLNTLRPTRRPSAGWLTGEIQTQRMTWAHTKLQCGLTYNHEPKRERMIGIRHSRLLLILLMKNANIYIRFPLWTVGEIWKICSIEKGKQTDLGIPGWDLIYQRKSIFPLGRLAREKKIVLFELSNENYSSQCLRNIFLFEFIAKIWIQFP